MGIEIFVNAVMLAGAAFCFWNVGQDIPPSTVPGAMDASVWPRLLLGGLIVALIFNIRAVHKANSAPGATKEIALGEFFTPKFLGATAILIAYAVLLDYTGFLVTTVVFFCVFSCLIGLRKIGRMIIGSAAATILMYAVFQLGLQVMLPRGAGMFRAANIWLETLMYRLLG